MKIIFTAYIYDYDIQEVKIEEIKKNSGNNWSKSDFEYGCSVLEEDMKKRLKCNQ